MASETIKNLINKEINTITNSARVRKYYFMIEKDLEKEITMLQIDNNLTRNIAINMLLRLGLEKYKELNTKS